ncbi:MAG TPA: sodium:proton antiporter [Acetobacteraceae bacterium]|jgi:CPA1 family monovalent cation:H+ antiporter|nr:sodium:proton antiporter [Acetobacteraceae bacterium]
MAVFELILGLLLAGVALALAAPRFGVPWPALLAVAGAVLAFVPGMPAVDLDPDLALALFVAPVLLDAAFDASPRDLRDNWKPLTSLVVVLVLVTVVAVAVTARWLRPDLPWAAAVALGAIVAPPDAAAATAVLRQVRLPHRLVVILEGESLLNDATALLVYRLAVGAVAGGVTLWTMPLLALASVCGLAFGWAMARAYLLLMRPVEDGPAKTLLQFLGTFGVWLLADRLGLSAILTVVAFAITLAQQTTARLSARQRRASYAVWEVAVFVLNVLAFILVGLQLRRILARLDGAASEYVLFAGAVLAACILVRLVWVMLYNVGVRWKNRHFGVSTRRPMMVPSLQGGIVIAWCGMRGIVTLAAALALPIGFPRRDLIVFSAFCVVLGTLVLQGMTLRPLLLAMTLPRDRSLEKESKLARTEAARAALDALDGDRESEAGRLLAHVYEARLAANGAPIDPTGLVELRRRALAAERERLAALRRSGAIGDDTFHVIEEELDWAEAEAAQPGT